jgi:hypothetical protein
VFFNKLDAFTVPRFTMTGAPPATKRTRILQVTQHVDNIWNEGSSYLCSQITDVENAAPLHVDIPRTGGRGSDLLSEDLLQEYLQSPHEYLLLVLPFKDSLLTHEAEPFLRRSQICSYSRISQHFMEPEGSLPCSQEPSTGPYPELDQSNPYHPIHPV